MTLEGQPNLLQNSRHLTFDILRMDTHIVSASVKYGNKIEFSFGAKYVFLLRVNTMQLFIEVRVFDWRVMGVCYIRGFSSVLNLLKCKHQITHAYCKARNFQGNKILWITKKLLIFVDNGYLLSLFIDYSTVYFNECTSLSLNSTCVFKATD